jgi:hypothetical protein
VIEGLGFRVYQVAKARSDRLCTEPQALVVVAINITDELVDGLGVTPLSKLEQLLVATCSVFRVSGF